MVLSMPDRQTLIAIIQDVSLEMATAPTFRLASRQRTNFYIDLRSTMGHPLAVKLVGRGMLGLLADVDKLRPVARLAAVETGGIAVATAMLAESNHIQPPVLPHAFTVRRRAKPHGRGGLLAGLPVNRGINRGTIKGQPVVIVEDTATTGKSALHAAQAVRNAGGHVAAILAVVNRGEKAEANCRKQGIPFYALLNARQDLLPSGFTPLTRWPPRRR